MRKGVLITIVVFAFVPFSVSGEKKKLSEEEFRARIEQLRYQEEKRMAELRPKLNALLNYDIELLQAALKIKVLEKYQGAVIVSVDSFTNEIKYLGKIEDQFSNDSIFNEFGTYGSKFSPDSIWNEFGSYGDKFSSESSFNKFTSTPPSIIKDKKVIGYLTVNKFISGGVDPNWLKSFFVY